MRLRRIGPGSAGWPPWLKLAIAVVIAFTCITIVRLCFSGIATIVRAVRIERSAISPDWSSWITAGTALVLLAAGGWLILWLAGRVKNGARDNPEVVAPVLAGVSTLLFLAVDPAAEALGLSSAAKFTIAAIPTAGSLIGLLITAKTPEGSKARSLALVTAMVLLLLPIALLVVAAVTLPIVETFVRQSSRDQIAIVGCLLLYVALLGWATYSIWLDLRRGRRRARTAVDGSA